MILFNYKYWKRCQRSESIYFLLITFPNPKRGILLKKKNSTQDTPLHWLRFIMKSFSWGVLKLHQGSALECRRITFEEREYFNFDFTWLGFKVIHTSLYSTSSLRYCYIGVPSPFCFFNEWLVHFSLLGWITKLIHRINFIKSFFENWYCWVKIFESG